jgi:hypothetical protein
MSPPVDEEEAMQMVEWALGSRKRRKIKRKVLRKRKRNFPR